MKEYNHQKIESNLQKKWEEEEIFFADKKSKKPKFYGLIEFPYPSGAGLHVGHIRSNTAMDIICRQKRMQGYNVLFPIGWDAFGLPTENYAIKTGKHPRQVTKENTDIFRTQLKKTGTSFDWSREINTTDPAYYKWTQWIFLKLFENDLAYKKKMPINWCLSCKIGLANEEVVDGSCERCGGKIERREKEQWMLAITKYADRLDRDLDEVDFIEKVKVQQRNWIGRSEGAKIKFEVVLDSDVSTKVFGSQAQPDSSYKHTDSNTQPDSSQKHTDVISVFTTRPDTLFGCTYMVLAPEHELLEKLKDKINNFSEAEKYIKKAQAKSDLERQENKEKTGVELKGIKVINPANQEEIPVYIADYVLTGYGTGAIMAVPAHDRRDFDFAKKHGINIISVILPLKYIFLQRECTNPKEKEEYQLLIDQFKNGELPYGGSGPLRNSEEFDGMDSEEVKKEITKFVGGEMTISYKLRDWVFSRQRYWGEPIPVVHCAQCGIVPLSDKDLPLELPEIEKYEPTDNGESPLAAIEEWVNTKCPKCKGEAKRETDVMPNWAGSSWYFLRYCDPDNDKVLADKKAIKHWLPVDWYNGGMEHTTLHLLYSRFWHKFLFDIGVVSTNEPYAKRTSHGIILAEDGRKMSKSFGNVINPDNIIEKFGADTLRVYEMFMGPFDQAIAWNTDGLVGVRRWLERIWRMKINLDKNKEVEKELHKTIKKVSEDIESMKFNTAISQMMIFTNLAEKQGITQEQFELFLTIFSPFAPHLTDELTKRILLKEEWPKYDEKMVQDEEVIIPVQINGKRRGEIKVVVDISEEEILEKVKNEPEFEKWLVGDIKKIIFVPGKILNIVINN